MRCKVCGRPYDGEALKAGEIACQGCHGEYLAFAVEITPATKTDSAHLTYTDDQALAMARQNHEKRELAAGAAVILARYEKNAAGLHGATGLPLALAGSELATVKADAAKMVSRLRGL